MRQPRRLERIVKGFASYRRLQILELLQANPELSLSEISERLKMQFRNTSQHISKMASAGLVMKRHDGTEVRHKLTERGEKALEFARKLE